MDGTRGSRASGREKVRRQIVWDIPEAGKQKNVLTKMVKADIIMAVRHG